MQGKFIWYELMTTDDQMAVAFYRALLGWQAKEIASTVERYTVMSVGEVGIGGIMTIPKEACDNGATPGWIGYIHVDDVDAFAKRITAAGGVIHKPAMDIPDIGRFCVVGDPQGAVFVLFKPNSPHASGPPPNALPPGTPGSIGWHELHAEDWEKDFDFYSGLFGWTKREAMDMGPMGVYQLFALDAKGDAQGGMMNSPQMPRPCWIYYFYVADIDAAEKRVKDNGGQVIMGPQEVPGELWIINGLDPQGAMFALVGPRKK
jgi:predicted enzyme related to lactoylglutathione lyase